MRAPLRLDLGPADLAAALAQALVAIRPAERLVRVERRASPAGEALAFLSVRSAWDALLGALAPPRGAEVLASAVTVPGMATIAEHHGLVTLPLDLDPETLAPDPDTLSRALGPRARVLLVAHLFGGRADVDPLVEPARRCGLVLVEDAAQAWAADGWRGHPASDVVLFSFGTIKTATALGGALALVRDPALRERMRAWRDGLPMQSRGEHLGRVAKAALLARASTPRAYGLLVRALEAAGVQRDALLLRAVRGFPADELVARIRRRPCAPLLALLERRLRRYPTAAIRRRAAAGDELVRALGPHVVVPGARARGRTHWVVPVLADDPGRAVATLRAAGFDATRRSSLVVLEPPAGRSELAPRRARALLEHLVFVPSPPDLTERERARMAAALEEAALPERDLTPAQSHSTQTPSVESQRNPLSIPEGSTKSKA